MYLRAPGAELHTKVIARPVRRTEAAAQSDEVLIIRPGTDAALAMELGADAVVFTPGYFQDGAGRLFNPRDSAAAMMAGANAPVYGPLDTFIGIGAVGGVIIGLIRAKFVG